MEQKPDHIMALKQLGRQHTTKGDVKKAQFYYEQELHICQKTGNRRVEGEAQRDLGAALQTQSKLEQAKPHLEQALQLCRATGDRRNEGWALLILGNNHLRQGHTTH